MPPKPPIRIPRTPAAPKFRTSPPNIAAKATPRALPKSRPRPTIPPVSSPSPPSISSSTIGRDFRKYGSIAFFSFCGMLFLRDHFVSFDTVNGSSMAPTLSPHAHETGKKDRILIQRNIRLGKAIQRGDVVTFWKPHKPNEISIKRVIAVGGDTVFPHRGYALDVDVVNTKRVEGGWDGLPDRDADAVGGEKVQVGRVTVPKGHVWVEGDNWRKSYDSCDFGPVSLGLVDGRAVGVWRGWGWRSVGDGRERKGRGKSIVVVGEEEASRYFNAGV